MSVRLYKLSSEHYKQLEEGKNVVLKRSGKADKTLSVKNICEGITCEGKLIDLNPLIKLVEGKSKKTFPTEITNWMTYKSELDAKKDGCVKQLNMLKKPLARKQVSKERVSAVRTEFTTAYKRALTHYYKEKNAHLDSLGWLNKKVEQYRPELEAQHGTSWQKFVLENKVSFSQYKAEQKAILPAKLKAAEEKLAESLAASLKLQEDLNAINQELEALKAQNPAQRIDDLIAEKADALTKLAQEQAGRKQDVERLKKEKEAIGTQLMTAIAESKQLLTDLKQANQKEVSLSDTIKKLNAEKTKIEEELRKAEKKGQSTADLEQEKAKYTEALDRVTDLSAKVSELQAANVSIQEELDILKTQQPELQERIETLTQEKAEMKTKLDKALAAGRVVFKRLEEKTTNSADALGRVTALSAKVSELQAANVSIQEELDTLKTQQPELQERIETLTQEKAEMKTKLDEAVTAGRTVYDRLEEEKTNSAKAGQYAAKLSNLIDKLNAELEQRNGDSQAMQQLLEETQKNYQDKIRVFEKLLAKNQKLLLQINQARTALTETTERLTEAEKKYQQLESEKSEIQAKLAQLEKENAALKQNDPLKNVTAMHHGASEVRADAQAKLNAVHTALLLKSTTNGPIPPPPPAPPVGPSFSSTSSAKPAATNPGILVLPAFNEKLLDGVQGLFEDFYQKFADQKKVSIEELKALKTTQSEERVFVFKKIPQQLMRPVKAIAVNANAPGNLMDTLKAAMQKRRVGIQEAVAAHDPKTILKIEEAMTWNTELSLRCQSNIEACAKILNDLDEGKELTRQDVENRFKENDNSLFASVFADKPSSLTSSELIEILSNKAGQLQRTLDFTNALDMLLMELTKPENDVDGPDSESEASDGNVSGAEDDEWNA